MKAMSGIEKLLAGWDGLGVVCRYDAESEAWIFICLHDNSLGVPTGGTRMAVYESPADGLLDGMRLAEGMTHKWAAVELAFGGGKAVLALARPLEGEVRKALLHRYGRLIESLRGTFRTGEDLGTTTFDMLEVAQETGFVHGFDRNGRKIDPGPFTARGVASGIRAALAAVFGDSTLEGRRILVEGVGNVGGRLAAELAASGADLLLADLDRARVEAIAGELGGTVVDARRAHATPCDVYSPCAVGATLNSDSIPELACRIVAGSANNQLRELADAQRLAERGIVYVPDFIINAGGAVAFARLDDGAAEAEVFSEVERIGNTTRTILEAADAGSETTLDAARRRVEAVLAKARERSS
jgi:leucine dehydrogenase